MKKNKNEEFNGIFSAIDMKQTKYKIIYNIINEKEKQDESI